MNIIWLYLLGFLSNMTAGILSPTLPLYLQGMGAPIFLISTIVTIYGLGKTIGLVYLGHQSDRKGRDTIMAFELSSFIAFSILLTLARQPLLVLALAIPYTLAGNLPTVVTASVGDAARGRNISLLMGGFMLSIGTGFAMGNYIGGYLVASWGFQIAYYVMAGFALISLMVVLFGIKGARKDQLISTERTSVFERMRVLVKYPRVISTGTIATVINLAGGLNLTFFPLLAVQVGLSPADIGLILAVRGICSTAVRVPIGFLGVHSRYKIIAITPFLSALALSLMWLANSFNAFSFIVAIEGVAQGMFLTLGRTEVAEAVSGTDTGMGLGVLDLFSFSGQTFFVFVLGAVAAYLGLRSVFAVGAVLTLVGLGLALYLHSMGTRMVGEPSPSRLA